MIILLPIAIALLGLFLYFAATNPKWQEVGKIMLFSGLLAWLLQAQKVVELFK